MGDWLERNIETVLATAVAVLIVLIVVAGFAACGEAHKCEAAGGHTVCITTGSPIYVKSGPVLVPIEQQSCSCVGARQ